MKPAWSRTRTLAAGVALILLANGVALFGVWRNRAGEPESQLVLNERELVLPYRGYRHKENSGLQLRLAWRVPERFDGEAHHYYYGASGGTPQWLDARRMAELGFDVRAPAAGGERRYTRQLPREALLVLELAGPAWQRALESARASAARHEAAAAANPGSKEFAERARQARERVAREERENSRLFAIDVGRDLAALRAQYADRSRYMILRCTVRPQFQAGDARGQLTGHVSALAVDQINVPFDLRPVVERLEVRPYGGDGVDGREGQEGPWPRYQARLAIGTRLEPWIAALTRLPGH